MRWRRGLPGPDRPGLSPRGVGCAGAGGVPALPRASAGDRGAVTAELAVGLVAVAAVLLALLATGAATLTRITCVDAARTGARAAALGESDGDVVAAARRVLGGRGADVVVARDDRWVSVTVTAPFTGWSAADGLRTRATATAWSEP